MNQMTTEFARPVTRRSSSILLWAIVIFFVIAIIWAAFTKLDRTVRAIGRVIPTSQLQIVSNPEGGIVQRIIVRVGDAVARGMPLLELDRTQTRADLGSGKATVGALELKIARLTAEVAGREPQYPAVTDPAMADQVAVERSLHLARMADLGHATEAADARLEAAQREAASAAAMLRSRESVRDEKLHEVTVIGPLVDKGIEPRLSLVQAQAAADAARADAESAIATLARTRAQVAEARSARAEALQQWRAQAATELVAAQAEYGARGQTIPALEKRAARTVVRAPVSGTVNRVLVTTAGSAIQPGQPLVEIVPGNDQLLIDARVLPADIATVAIGQRAKVSLTAYNRATYGLLDATVVSISPDALVDEKSGQSFYTIRVRTKANQLADPEGKMHPIGPGMVAEVDLLGEKRTILEYLLTPILDTGRTALRE